MSARLGVGIGRDALRAVLLRRGHVVWSASAGVAEGEPLRDALVRLLSGAPRARFGQMKLVAAVGPAASQVRRFEGLPPVKHPRLLARLAAENAGRFFLRNGVPLSITDIHIVGPGQVWAAAVETAIVDDIAEATRLVGARLEGTRPTVAVLPFALRGTAAATIVWRDADTRADVVVERSALTRVRRLPCFDAIDPPAPPTETVHPALRALGDAGWRFADAFGAAMAPSRAPMLVHARAESRARDRWTRLGILTVFVLASAVAALAAPAMLASRTAERAATRIGELHQVQRELARAQDTLVQLSSTLRQMAAFAAERRSMLHLLGALAETTPESTAIVTLRLDGRGGSLVALAPRAAAVLPALGDLREIMGATISSPVTREQIGAQELERVTIRFQLARTRSPGAHP